VSTIAWEVQLAIEIALGRAAMAKRNALRPEDVDAVEKVAKMKVGFM
jgi:hypothetical protein